MFLVSTQEKCSSRVPFCVLLNRSIFLHKEFLNFLPFLSVHSVPCLKQKQSLKMVIKAAPPV